MLVFYINIKADINYYFRCPGYASINMYNNFRFALRISGNVSSITDYLAFI